MAVPIGAAIDLALYVGDFSGMTLKQDLIVFVVTAFLFAACSFAMLTEHEALSRYPVVTYAFIATYGISALGWPIFCVRLVGKVIASAFRRLRPKI